MQEMGVRKRYIGQEISAGGDVCQLFSETDWGSGLEPAEEVDSVFAAQSGWEGVA